MKKLCDYLDNDLIDKIDDLLSEVNYLLDC